MITNDETYNIEINKKYIESKEEYDIRIKEIEDRVNSWPEWKKSAITYIPTLLVRSK